MIFVKTLGSYLKYNVRDKPDVTEIIDIFTCEDIIFTIQYPVPLFSLCTKSLIAVLKDANQLSEENGGGPFC